MNFFLFVMFPYVDPVPRDVRRSSATGLVSNMAKSRNAQHNNPTLYRHFCAATTREPGD